MSKFNLVQLITGGASSDDLWAQRESWTDQEGHERHGYHGRVNQCLHGDQCEGHACYCMHDKGPRKCGLVGWGRTDGAQCPHFKANPHWAGDMERTYDALKALGLAKDIPNEEATP